MPEFQMIKYNTRLSARLYSHLQFLHADMKSRFRSHLLLLIQTANRVFRRRAPAPVTWESYSP